MMTQLEEIIEILDDGAVTYDGFDDALIGTAEHWSTDGLTRVALYNYTKCIEILAGQGMTNDDADEYMQFNIVGGYVGVYTPVFAHLSA